MGIPTTSCYLRRFLDSSRNEPVWAQLYDEVRKVRKAIDELAEMLNRHRLYPLILYAHCELCPTYIAWGSHILNKLKKGD